MEINLSGKYCDWLQNFRYDFAGCISQLFKVTGLNHNSIYTFVSTIQNGVEECFTEYEMI